MPLILFLVLYPGGTFAQGGPPMVTDDPGTPGNRHWEINIAAMGAFAGAEQLVEAPHFDVNYGLGERIQLKVEAGLVISHSGLSEVQTGATPVLTGVKYRFLDEDKTGVAVSIYPQFQFNGFPQ